MPSYNASSYFVRISEWNSMLNPVTHITTLTAIMDYAAVSFTIHSTGKRGLIYFKQGSNITIKNYQGTYYVFTYNARDVIEIGNMESFE